MERTVSTGAEGIEVITECPVCGGRINENNKHNHCRQVADITLCPNKDTGCKNKNGNRRKGCDGYSCGHLGISMMLANNILVDGHGLTREGPDLNPWLYKVREGLKRKYAQYKDMIEQTALSHVPKKDRKHPLYMGRGSIQAHHLICSEAMNSDKGKNLCRTIGYNINCKLNGVYLPADIKLACHTGIQRHRGSHALGFGENGNKSYVETVNKRLRSILSKSIINARGKCENVDRDEIITELNSLSSELLDNIKNYVWTITWDGFHYADGGIGCGSVKNLEEKRTKIREVLDEETLKAKGIVLKNGSYRFDDIRKISEDEELSKKITDAMTCPRERNHDEVEGYTEELKEYRNSKLKPGY